MLVRVLGSSAGGGFPQWNCNCSNCKGLREKSIDAKARTQSSIAVSANGIDWVLFNTSPDIHAQINSFPPLQPARKVRDTGIAAIVLSDAQIDHSTGLLLLREHQKPWIVYTSTEVKTDLTNGFPIFPLLSHFCGTNHRELKTDQKEFTIPEVDGLAFTAVPLRSEAPPFSPYRHKTRPGDNLGFEIKNTKNGKSLFYAPGLGHYEQQLDKYFAKADCLLVDGTVWTNDELQRQKINDKLASDMGHLAQSHDGGILDILKPYKTTRKILIHINNTNPILNEQSEERKLLKQYGVEVAYDGMEITL